jgi:hypothetical protein
MFFLEKWRRRKKMLSNSKALKYTNQEQIIEEGKVRPNLDLVTFYVKTAHRNPKPQACNLETLTLAV